MKGRSLQEQETGGGGNVVEDDIPMEHLHTSFTSLIYLGEFLINFHFFYLILTTLYNNFFFKVCNLSFKVYNFG